MITPQLQKIIIIFITLMFVVYVGYGLFSKQPDPKAFESISVNSDSEDILALADKIEKTTIDSSIFSNALFITLVDSSSIVAPEEQGRNNPFAAIGFDNVQSQTVKTVVAKKTGSN